MDTIKRLNVIGLSLELGGVLLIALSDYVTRRAEAEYESIRGNPLVETFEATLEDKIRFASPEERRYKATLRTISSKLKLWFFRIGLGLIALGTTLQLGALIFSKN